MSRDLGRDVPDLEKLYARKLWADFSHPILFGAYKRGLRGADLYMSVWVFWGLSCR